MKQPKQCYFCAHDAKTIDWKDAETLKEFLGYQYKIDTRKRTGLCAKHQRRVARAIKRARIAGVLPFTPVEQ